MDHTQVLVRTAKAKEEIRSKAFDLSPRLRRLLLLVDGRSTLGATLSRLAAVDADAESQLDALVADGFLAPRQAALELGTFTFEDWQALADQHAPGRGAGPYGTQTHKTPRFNLEKAKGFARFIVLGYLGPVGAHRVERIDVARSADGLRAELRELCDILPKLLPKRQAKQALAQLAPLLQCAGSHRRMPTREPPETAGAGAGVLTALPSGTWPDVVEPGADATRPELAATILAFAEPLTAAASGSDAIRRAVQMAIICWNAAMLPGNKGLETIAPALREIAGGDRLLERELFEIFDVMRARKQARFRGDDRFIVNWSLAETREGLHLAVAAETLPVDASAPELA